MQKISLTRNQKAILTGTLLGDGYLQKTGLKNARLRLEHGGKQKDYLLWKMRAFPRLFQGKPVHLSRVHPKTLATYEYWRAQSSSSPVFGKWRTLFYPDGKKRIPENLVEILTEPLALAVWYMDDGYYNPKDKNSFLYLGRVSKKEAVCAQNMLIKNFELSARVYDKKEKGFALYFSPAETKKLHVLIRQHLVLPTFAYKLGDIP
jgi:LAGLIDADG DNA endonuclease family